MHPPHDRTGFVTDLAVVGEHDTADPLALLGPQTLSAGHALCQFHRFLASTMLVDDGGDDSAEIIESQPSALAGDDVHTGRPQQTPMQHDVEDVLA